MNTLAKTNVMGYKNHTHNTKGDEKVTTEKEKALRSGILLEECQKYYSDEDADFYLSAKAGEAARKGGW